MSSPSQLYRRRSETYRSSRLSSLKSASRLRVSRNPLSVAAVIHAPIGLPLSITNLANLETLNDQPIKTGKAISFQDSSFSSVDAIIAFLVKFNPAVESLDLSEMKNLQSKSPAVSCSTHATPDVIIIGLPSEFGNLQSLTKLNCWNCSSLKSK